MPSPFPGMDPYLELPAFFPGLHDRLINALSEALQGRLPEPYYAEIGVRTWVEVSQRQIEPDVEVLRAERPTPVSETSNGGVAVAVQTRTEPLVIRVPYEAHRDTRVDLYNNAGGEEKLITTIEILSPANKTPGAKGRDLYLRKQEEVLDSSTHLVEIDLLRGGQHTTAVPKDRLAKKAPGYDYHVCVHHFDNLEDHFVWPFTLADSLPEIIVPLLPGDRPVTVDLQLLLDRCYDAGPYRRRVRYAALTPEPALRPEQAEWANKILRERGILPKV
jgi:hypothetical protein